MIKFYYFFQLQENLMMDESRQICIHDMSHCNKGLQECKSILFVKYKYFFFIEIKKLQERLIEKIRSQHFSKNEIC